MNFRFSQYTREELVRCGAAFEAAARAFGDLRPRASTTEWTEFVLDAFASAAGEGLTVDARSIQGSIEPLMTGLARRQTKGEFLLDLAHTSYPGYAAGDYSTPAYWVRALEGRCRVHLALESELGSYRNQDESFTKVLEDAAKVAAFRADLKVVVFASQCGEEETRKLVERSRRSDGRAEDTTPWLWTRPAVGIGQGRHLEALTWGPGLDRRQPVSGLGAVAEPFMTSIIDLQMASLLDCTVSNPDLLAGADEGWVWPNGDGGTVGEASPPFPMPHERHVRIPPSTSLLSLIDAIRVGGASERELASDELRRRLP